MRPDGNGFNEADERLKAVKRGNALQQDFEMQSIQISSAGICFDTQSRQFFCRVQQWNLKLKRSLAGDQTQEWFDGMLTYYAHILSQRKRKTLEDALGITDAQQNVEANV